MPANSRNLRNLGMGANYLMSHILHFYHLVALDYVDVNGTGLIPKGFLCPNYDSNYYARGIDPILQTGGLGVPAYTVNNAPVANPGIPAAALGDLTPYLAGQYVRALKFRRMAHQLGALFTGKMPHASCFTPGCVTTKAYNPAATSGKDAQVVVKVHELLYAGPGLQLSDITDRINGVTSRTFAGSPVTLANPHPESILGFIGKPANFWQWAANGYAPGDLPVWAAAGVPGAGVTYKTYTGTYLFDAVAAAHVFPEYFWVGQGYGRYLAWGIFEGADVMGFGDGRLITRGRTHVDVRPNGVPGPVNFTALPAQHFDPLGAVGTKDVVQEYTRFSWYNELILNKGRHPWKGKSNHADPNKAGAYTFAKSPRYYWGVGEGGPGDWVPYEVGPLARGMSNARGLTTPGGPATPGEVLAVQAGGAYAYYPGILNDVDVTVSGLFAIPGGSIGVFPAYGTNLAAHLTFLQTAIPGSPALYLPPNAFSPAVLANLFAYDYSGGAVLDRIAARALETYFVGMQMLSWFNALNPAQATCVTKTFGRKAKCAPTKGKGAGLTEAPRGALGHWIKIGNKTKRSWKNKVHRYQIITPTAWNISPKDHNAAPGPMEQCVLNTPLVSEAEPLEVLRVIHSFDPCCACTVHLTNAKKEKVFKATLEALM